MNKVIVTNIVYYKLFSFLGMLVIVSGVACLFASTFWFKIKFIQFSLLLIILLPVIFKMQLLNYFSRYVHFKFDNNNMEVVIDNGNENKISNIYPINEIKSYRIQFTSRMYTDVMFKLKSGKKIPFSIYLKKNEAENIDTDELIKYIHEFISNYNQSSLEKIQLMPSFYASLGGTIMIIILIILFLGDIILHIVLHKMGILPITLFLVLGIIARVLLQRNKDLKYYNKMK